MPKEYFSVEGSTSFGDVDPGTKVHVIGVCGVAMAQLAVLLAKQGYAVSGSDKEFYEPMASFLSNSPIKLFHGFHHANISADTGMVVIGNSISYGNVEVDEVERRRVPYTFFPKALFESVIAGTHSIVVTGTHGKSSTTALCSTVMEKLDASPGYFIGAQVQELPTSLHRGEGGYSVIEGDEYDSAFFANVPKFSFYKPDTLVITSIEFDHADIYVNVEEIKEEFTRLALSLSSEGTILCCSDDPIVKTLSTAWRKTLPCRIISYGSDEGADVRIIRRTRIDSRTQRVTVESEITGTLTYEIPLAGHFSALNATAVLLVTKILGFDSLRATAALSTFRGLRRRQEVRYDQNEITLIEDFAHHPTAVRETVRGIRERYNGRRLWAVFEPRSNTSRRKIFQADYVAAFAGTDQVVLAEVAARQIDQGVELLSVKELASSIADSGVPAVSLPDAVAILSYIMGNLRTGDVVLLMSNGSFGGLPALMQEALEAR